jgi:twitching motility protein PilT
MAAAIDQLLKLVEAQKADALVVASDKVPVLKKAGADVALSMPKVSHDMVSMFVEDLVDALQMKTLIQEGSIKLNHALGELNFAVEIRREGTRLHLGLYLNRGGRPGAAPATPAHAAAPAPVAPPAPRVPAVGGRPPPARVEAREPALPPLSVGTGSAPATDYRQPGVNLGDLHELVLQAHRDGASDVLLSTGMSARVRTGGELREAGLVCEAEQILGLAAEQWSAAQAEEFEQTGSTDLALDLAPGPGMRALRFRVNVFRQQRGVAAAVRPVRGEVPTLAQLGLPDDFKNLVQYTSGLVLMTGPTGSGKSTTLSSLIEHVNLTMNRHVITLEDPIEFLYTSKRSLIHQREVGRDVASFASGLRAALREDPDIILLGEMRDEDTISAALTAAETGHLVLSTLHAGAAAMAIDRIIDVFPGAKQPQIRLQLSSALRVVLTQVLVPASRGHDRIPAVEKMVVTAAVASQIREGRAHQIATQIQTGRSEGMVSMEQSLMALVRGGKISLDSALAFAPDPEALRRALRG